MAQRDGHELQVRLEGLEVGPEHIEEIGRVVQKAVLSEVARLDLVREDFIVRFPRDWLGIWIRSGQFEKEFGR